MTATDIITAVRDRLGDIKKERWKDSTLLLYVSLCQNDICMFTNFYRKSDTIQLVADQYIYPLPTDCLNVHRLEYLDQLLPVETRNNIDSNNATFPCVLFDNLSFNSMEFILGDTYETLTEALVSVYGVVSTSDSDAVDTEACELVDTFGVVSDIDCDLTNAPAQPLDEVLVYYTATPAQLVMNGEVLPTTELILPNIWFQAFLHFVCGMALQDDNDANNIQRGELEATKYLRVLGHIQKTSAKDFTGNIRTKLTTNVRRI